MCFCVNVELCGTCMYCFCRLLNSMRNVLKLNYEEMKELLQVALIMSLTVKRTHPSWNHPIDLWVHVLYMYKPYSSLYYYVHVHVSVYIYFCICFADTCTHILVKSLQTFPQYGCYFEVDLSKNFLRIHTCIHCSRYTIHVHCTSQMLTNYSLESAWNVVW